MTIVKKKSQSLFDRLPADLHIPRTEILNDLKGNLAHYHFITLLGPGGSGKTSLIRRELLPALARGEVSGQAGKEWRVAMTAPSADPIGHLAQSLAKPGVLQEQNEADPAFFREAKQTLLADSSGLINLYQQASLKSENPFNLLIIVDQVEDLARYKRYFKTRGESINDLLYIRLLVNAAREKIPVYIAFALNSSQIEFISEYQSLSEIVHANRLSIPFLRYSEAEQFLRGGMLGQQEEAENSTSELSAEERQQIIQDEESFVENFLQDLHQLIEEEDRQQLFKFHFSLRTLKENLHSVGDSTPSILKAYQDINGLNGVIEHHLEGLFNQLPPQEQRTAASIFKALTLIDPTNVAVRRPASRQELLAVCQRKQDENSLTYASLDQSIQHFNTERLTLFALHNLETGISENPVVSEKAIVDLAETAPLSNWPRLARWVSEENIHGTIYKNLVEDAKNFYLHESNDKTQKPSPQLEIPPSEKNLLQRFSEGMKDLASVFSSTQTPKEETQLVKEAKLYDRGQLEIAMKWKQDNQPNPAWAQRYVPIPFSAPSDEKASLEEEKLQSLADRFQNSTFQMAMSFLDQSQKAQNQKIASQEAERQQKLARAKRNSLIFGILGAVSFILFIVAIAFYISATRAKNNIELVEFTENLVQAHIISEEEDASLYSLNQLKRDIVGTNSIRSPEQVLQFLAEKNVIHTGETPEYKNISFNALLNLDTLFHAVDEGLPNESGKNQHKKRKKLLLATDNILNLEEKAQEICARQYLQIPYLYKTLERYLHAYSRMKRLRGKTLESYRFTHKGLVSALASNPRVKDQFVYGDELGFVIERNKDKRKDPKIIAKLNESITSLTYSADGEQLYVATIFGNIYRFSNMKTDGFNKEPSRIFEAGKSISFLKSIAEGQFLILGNAESLMLLKAIPKDDSSEVDYVWKETKPLEKELKEITCIEATSNGETILVSGREATLALTLNTVSERFDLVSQLSHKSVTISAIGISKIPHAQSKTGPQSILVAFGGETGRMWITKLEDLRKADTNAKLGDLTKELYRSRFGHKQAHLSTVSELSFNDKLPQLASSSLDGSIRLWNLHYLNEIYECIVLEDNGEGVWSFAYINDDELVSTENISLRIWKTNNQALAKALQPLRNDLAAEE